MKARKTKVTRNNTVLIKTSMPPGGFKPGQSYTIDFRDRNTSAKGGEQSDNPTAEQRTFMFKQKE